MSIKRVLKEIEELPVDKITVKRYGRTFQIYPWIKARFFHKFVMGKEVLQEKDASVLLSQLQSLFYGFGNFFRSYNAWAFTNSSERTLIEGKYKDRLFDPIGETKGFKLLVIELRLFQFYPRRKVASKYVVSRSLLLFIEEVYQRVFLRKIELQSEELIQEILKRMDIESDYKSIVRKYLAQYRVIKTLLRFVPNPKVVFLSVSYANFGYIQAFKEKGIKVVEMQHGLIGEQHNGYLYYSEFLSNQFPDELVVFGEKEVCFFKNDTVFPVESVHAMGRYVVDYFATQSRSNSSQIQSISVSLQDGMWNIAMLEFVLACNEITAGKINWVIQTRRTPVSELTSQFELPENMVFHQATIYEAIAQTDMHMTIYSTTSIEALSMGKQVILYDFQNAATSYLSKFIGKNEFVHFVDSASDFAAFIENYQNADKEMIQGSNRENIRPHYLKNLDTYLKKMADEIF